MTELKIDVSGLNEVIKKLSDSATKLRNELTKTMTGSMDLLGKEIPVYTATGNPAIPAGSKYKRTFRLGYSMGFGGMNRPWIYNVKGTANDIQGEYGTTVPYAKYVIKAGEQAYMHKGRWWTEQEIAAKAEPKIVKIWNEMVRRILGK